MANFALFGPLQKLGEGWRDLWVTFYSFIYDQTLRIDLMGVLCTTAEKNALVKKRKKESTAVGLRKKVNLYSTSFYTEKCSDMARV